MIKSLIFRPISRRPLISTRTFRKLMITATLGASVAMSGCSMLSVYKIDLPQGTPITQTQAQKLKVGMNQNQVLYILGSPAIKDTLAPSRWDYIYDYKAGTEGQRKGIADVNNASQHLIVYFDANGIVNRIEGLEDLTAEQAFELSDASAERSAAGCTITLSVYIGCAMDFDKLLQLMIKKNGSDLFITADVAPSMKVNGQILPVGKTPLTPEQTMGLVKSVMTKNQVKEFEETSECQFAITDNAQQARFRVSAFMQRDMAGMILRKIENKIPSIEDLRLPPSLKELSMKKRGIILLVGATGTGKSTTLAAMVGYRNQNSHGHIITIEDPIEFVHQHRGCIITQREVGIDTLSFEAGLKNTLRQAPDVILIGEIRNREVMSYAIQYAETGHLVFATLHANNANQAIDRIIHFFETDRHNQLFMDLSLNLQAIVAQQLIPTPDGKSRRAAIEILLNSQLISDYIRKGEVHEIKEVMTRSRDSGMQTFDQALFDLYESGDITYKDAISHADSPNDLRLKIKLSSKNSNTSNLDEGADRLSLDVT